jgi:hypothetical protein
MAFLGPQKNAGQLPGILDFEASVTRDLERSIRARNAEHEREATDLDETQSAYLARGKVQHHSPRQLTKSKRGASGSRFHSATAACGS